MVYRAVLALSGILVLASNASAQSPAPQLLELEKQYAVAMKARDAEKLASFYAQDAVLISPNSPAVRGLAAVRQDLQKMFKDFPNTTVEGTPRKSEISGDLGYTEGDYVTTVKRSNGETINLRGAYLTVWKKVNGAWKILYDTYNTNEPPPKPPTPPMPPTPPTPPQ